MNVFNILCNDTLVYGKSLLQTIKKMYLSQVIIAGILVLLVTCFVTNGQSITFGGATSGGGGGTLRPPTRRPVNIRGPVAPTPGPIGPAPSKGTEDLLLVLLKKVEEISQKQDHYQSILLNAIKENGTQETLDSLISESESLAEQVNITTKIAREIVTENINPTTVGVNALFNDNSTGDNVDTRVGFSVRKAAGTNPDTYLLQSSKTPISFQEVLSNVGNGWTGLIFKAPVAGHYFFTFHAQSSDTGDFTMSLRKNGVYQVTGYGGKSGFQWGSNSALLNLKVGDTIYLTLDEGEIYEHPFNEAYTTLTGFLVFQ